MFEGLVRPMRAMDSDLNGTYLSHFSAPLPWREVRRKQRKVQWVSGEEASRERPAWEGRAG